MYDDDQDGDHADNYDRSAEQAVLGAMLNYPDAVAGLLAACPPENYYLPHHAAIAAAIAEAHNAGRPTDPVSLHDRFLAAKRSAHIGGAPYLHLLIQSAPTAANASWHAGIVTRYAEKRGLVDAGTLLVQMGDDRATDLDDVPELYDRAITMLTRRRDAIATTGIPTTGDAWTQTLDELEHPVVDARIPTGLRDLDDALYGGWAPGQLILIGARPGVGKSTLATGAAREAAIGSGVRTLMLSLEMSRRDIMRRLISAEASVPLHHLTGNAMTEHDWDRIATHAARIPDAPLHIDDTTTVTLAQLRHSIATLKRDGLGLAIIDYIQLMATPKAENRQQAVAALSRGLKLMALEFSIPIIALTQLNRESAKRSDRRPAMSDLRESGALENDADVIILMHRDDVNGGETVRAGECDLIVEKNRLGAPTTVTVAFQGHLARCASMAVEPWTPHLALRSVA